MKSQTSLQTLPNKKLHKSNNGKEMYKIGVQQD